MTTPNVSKAPEQCGLVLARPSHLAKSMGLGTGDILVSIDGRAPPLPSRRRSASAEPAYTQRAVLGMLRDDEHWFVVGQIAELGRWQVSETLAKLGDPPKTPHRATNWEVWQTALGTYDVLRMRPGWGEALVPFYLVKMRLWEALALWCTLLVLSVMLGWVLGGIVQLCAWALFWRVAPDLTRRDFTADGLSPARVLAAPSERAMHQDVARLMPHLRFRHAGRAA